MISKHGWKLTETSLPASIYSSVPEANPFLISHFRSIGNRCRPLLRSQLQQVLDKQPPERVRYKQQFGQEPSEVNKLNARKAELFKEMSYLHTLLGNYQVADTRGAGHEVQVVFHSFRDNSGLTPASAASRILELQAQLSAIWEKTRLLCPSRKAAGSAAGTAAGPGNSLRPYETMDQPADLHLPVQRQRQGSRLAR
jgi:hypothetical protein